MKVRHCEDFLSVEKKRKGLGRITLRLLPSLGEGDWAVQPVFAAQTLSWLLSHGRPSPVLAGRAEQGVDIKVRTCQG